MAVASQVIVEVARESRFLGITALRPAHQKSRATPDDWLCRSIRGSVKRAPTLASEGCTGPAWQQATSMTPTLVRCRYRNGDRGCYHRVTCSARASCAWMLSWGYRPALAIWYLATTLEAGTVGNEIPAPAAGRCLANNGDSLGPSCFAES